MPIKTNVHKDKRAWWLSHEAFLTLQELAHQQGLQTAAFLEVISRELALQRLSVEQRASINAEAERIAAERQNEAQEHERTVLSWNRQQNDKYDQVQ